METSVGVMLSEPDLNALIASYLRKADRLESKMQDIVCCVWPDFYQKYIGANGFLNMSD